MAVKGYVFRITSAISSGTIDNGNGAKPYAARYADGTFVNTFASVREAQIPIEQHAGRRLVWTDISANGVEQWRGSEP